jgi:ketosteroid isomerase-like protein
MEIQKILTQYLNALEKSNLRDIIQLFAEDAVITSPLYGTVKAQQFYRELLTDTSKSKIMVLNTFISKNRNVGAAHFLYEWVLKDGTKTSFECVDVVRISDSGKIGELTIIYDTFAVRESFEKMKA